MRKFCLCLILLFVSFFVFSSLSHAYVVNTDLTTVGGLITASEGANPGNAVDNNASTYWTCPDGNQTIVYDFGTGTAYPIDKITLNISSSGTRNFIVYGTQDKVTWVNLYSSTYAVSSSAQTFTFNNDVAYRYISIQPVDASPQLKELELMVETIPATQIVFAQQPTDALAGAVISPPVTVQLKDASSVNVSQAGVSISMSLLTGAGALSGTTTVNTDSTGLATFSNLNVNASGSKTLQAHKTGFADIESSVFVISVPPTPTPSPSPSPSATPTPTLGSSTASFGGVVYGRVVDKFKSPLPEIKVEYSTLGDEYLGKNPVFTDNDGYYYFEDVDTGFGYGLVMSAKRYGTVTVNYPGTVVDSVVRVPDKTLIRGNSNTFTLSGMVKDLYLSPVSHARVRVKSSGDPHIVYTDSSGAFSISDLFVGTYTVTVKRNGYYVGRVKYLNTDGLDGSIDISLQEK